MNMDSFAPGSCFNPFPRNTGAGISVAGLAPGQLISVTGFSGQFIDYEIDPRFPSDLRRAH